MDYRFVKTFAKKIADEADVDKLIKEYKKKTDKSKKTTADKVKSRKEIAEDMIAEDKKELKRYHKYYYNMMIKALDITKQPRTLEKIKERVSDEIMKEPSVDWCVFLTFWLKECKIPLEDNETDYLNLLNYLLEAAGFNKLVDNSRENVITHFSLSSDCTWKQFISLMVQLKREEESKKKEEDTDETETFDYHNLHQDFRGEGGEGGKKGISYEEFRDFVKEGLAEDEKKTQKTYLEFDKTLTRKIEEYKEKNKKMPDASLSYSDIFPKDFMIKIDHALWRRTWYLSRMISKLIEKNVEETLENIREEYRRVYFGGEVEFKPYDFEKLSSDLWVKIDSKKVKKFFRDHIEEQDIEEGELSEKLFAEQWEIQKESLREYINWNARVSIEKIGRKYMETMEGEKKDVSYFIQRKYLVFDYCKKEEWDCIFDQYEKNEEYKTQRNQILRIEKTIFGNEKKAWDFLRDVDNEVAFRRSGKPFNAVMSGKNQVSKEMLLLTVLVCKRCGCKEIDRKYVDNMLKNCRFDTNLELPNNNPFMQYYQEAFNRIDQLGELSKKFEREMLYTHYCSVFHNIVQGKEVCSE